MNPDNKTALEWDYITWSKALDFWEKTIQRRGLCLINGLEIGARNGGLSWYFAIKHQSAMICSDLEEPTLEARRLHQSSGVEQFIQYESCDAAALPYPDVSFDFVVFKSVLGAVGRNNHPELQQKAIQEMYRVLKQGGVLFFAENLQGSHMHRFARKWFVAWGQRWRYVSFQEMNELLHIFEDKKLCSTGFFSAFIPKPEWLKNFVSRMDFLQQLVPQNWRYVGYGYAIKTG